MQIIMQTATLLAGKVAGRRRFNASARQAGAGPFSLVAPPELIESLKWLGARLILARLWAPNWSQPASQPAGEQESGDCERPLGAATAEWRLQLRPSKSISRPSRERKRERVAAVAPVGRPAARLAPTRARMGPAFNQNVYLFGGPMSF